MASTIDSGIDTGNDSNDSSLQEKYSKVDFEIPSPSSGRVSKCDYKSGINPTLNLDEVDDCKEQTSNVSSLLNDISNPKASLVVGSGRPRPPEPCSRNFTCGYNNVMTSNEDGDIFVAPYSTDYGARDLVTKMHRMRHALRFRCCRRSPFHREYYTVFKDHFKICRAVSLNNTDSVREMLMGGVTPNCYDSFKRTPLHLAACMGYADMVKLLLDYGADPNAKDSIGNTPLHLAACTNNVRVISLLMQAGTRLGEKDLAGHSPLQLAITKLNIMKRAVRPNPELQQQITQVVEMMTEYMKKKEPMEPSLLSRLFSVMEVKDSSEEIESNIQDLLSNLSLSSNS